MSTPSNPTPKVNTPAGAPARLNRRAAIRLGAALVVLAVLLVGLKSWQNRRGGAWLAEARRLAEAGEPGAALGHVDRFLATRPRDPQALGLRAELLEGAARSFDDFEGARKAYDAAIREAPDAPEAQAARRKAIEINLKLRYVEAALVHARELIARGADDADARRLLGTTLERAAKSRDRESLAEARDALRAAHELEPADPRTAARLAGLEEDVFEDRAAARAVLDRLLEASDDKVIARLTRYGHEAGRRQVEAARAEIDAAIALAADDRSVRVAAAEEALARRDAKGALAHLDAIPADRRDDAAYQYARGRVLQERGELPMAMAAWREALRLGRGQDAVTLFQLALLTINQGQLGDAGPLVDAYRRLTWDESGGQESLGSQFLRAALLLKGNRPAEAITLLEKSRLVAPDELQYQLNSTLGQAYEATNRREPALEAYRRAQAADPGRPEGYLAESRLLAEWRPDEALAALTRGLNEAPDDQQMGFARAALLARRQRQRPDDEALKAEAEKAARQAERGAADPQSLAILRAESLINAGKPEEALAELQKAPTPAPPDSRLPLARAALLARLARPEQALAALQGAPDEASTRLARARLLARLGSNAEAARVLADPTGDLSTRDRAECFRGLADLAASAGDLGQARQAAQSWAGLLPDDVRARWRLLELALAARDAEGAADATRQLEQMDGQGLFGSLAGVWDLLLGAGRGPAVGEAAIRQRLEEAIPKLDQLIAGHPAQPVGYHLKGQVCEKLGRNDEAIEAYRQAVQRAGGPLALGRLSSALARQGDFAALETLAAEQPEQAQAVLRLAAEAALAAGDKARARQLANAATRGRDEDPTLALWRAGLLARCGDPAAAEQALEALCARRPGESAGWLALVKFQVDRKRLDAARSALNRALKAAESADRPLLEAQGLVLLGDRAGAARAYDKALAAAPGDQATVEEVARFLEASGQLDRAEKALRDLLARAKADGKAPPRRAVHKLALLRSARPMDDEAWQEAYRLMLDDMAISDTPGDRLTRAQVLARGPRPQHRREALALLEGLIGSSADDLRVHALLAQLHMDDGAPPRARPHAERVARAGAAEGAAMLARILIDAGEHEAAGREIKRLSTAEPLAPRTVELEARLLAGQGDAAGAAGRLKAGFDAAWAAPGARADQSARYASVAADLDLPDLAEDFARRTAGRWPGGAALAAPALAAAGRVDAGIDLCAKVAVDPKAPAPARDAAVAAAGLAVAPGASPAARDRAEQLVVAARAREPGAPGPTLALAVLKHYRGAFEEEVALYRGLIGRQGSPGADVRFLNNLAWTLSEDLGRPDEGLAEIEKAIARVGWHAEFLDTRGVIRTRLGDHEGAIRDLDEVAQARRSPATLFHLARARHASGDMTRAREALELALKAGLDESRLQPGERPAFRDLMAAMGLQTAAAP